jgi:steroid delta-isomerase-like uncharacterized protein
MDKYLILIVLVFCSLTGCQNKEALSALDKPRDRKELEVNNREIAERYMAAISKGDFDALSELLSDDYAVYSPSGYPDPTSKEDYLAGMKDAAESFTQFVWNIEDIIASKDKVISRIIIRGVYEGDIPDLPSGLQEFEFNLISIMQIEDGKVVKEWQEDDHLGFARQMGMELAPAGSQN